jgi:hypothetical protein
MAIAWLFAETVNALLSVGNLWRENPAWHFENSIAASMIFLVAMCASAYAAVAAMVFSARGADINMRPCLGRNFHNMSPAQSDFGPFGPLRVF